MAEDIFDEALRIGNASRSPPTMAEDMIEALVAREEAALPGWHCLAVCSSECSDGTWYYAQVKRAEPFYFIAGIAERTQREAVQTAFAQARKAQGETVG